MQKLTWRLEARVVLKLWLCFGGRDFLLLFGGLTFTYNVNKNIT